MVAQASLTALQLPRLTSAHYTAYGFLTTSLVISLLATFFTWVLQRVYSLLGDADEIRSWLSDGIENDTTSEIRMQSSYASHQSMQIPFELVSIAIMLFIAGIAIYLGSAMVDGFDLGTGGTDRGNRAVFIAFVAGIVFACTLFGIY